MEASSPPTSALTFPWLFALASGVQPGLLTGPERCLFCGAPCGTVRAASDYLRDTFGSIGSLSRPGSRHVCEGCVLCLREDCDVPLCGGTTRRVSKAAMRMHSWAVTPLGVTAYTKAHRAELTSLLLDPPVRAWGCCWGVSIADSGQKQLLYLGRVNSPGPGPWTITLEGMPVRYDALGLRRALDLAVRIASVCGKPCLSESPEPSRLFALAQAWPSSWEAMAQAWKSSCGSPLWALAAWLCPSKEDCLEQQRGTSGDAWGGVDRPGT